MLYFNPRTREGCDLYELCDGNREHQISIHAPVKGATSLAFDVLAVVFEFQSTHP